MKAERRHELQQNDLTKTAVKVMQLPDIRRKLIGRILTGIAIVVLIGLLIRMRISNAEIAQTNASEHLAMASSLITENLRQPRLEGPVDGKYIAYVQKIAEQANSELDKVAAISSDAKLLAQAGVLRGDMNFLVANTPVLDSSTTAPSGPSLDREIYLSQALAAYQDVVDKYGDQPLNSISALFGIAAVKENRREWAEAGKRYNAILTNPDASQNAKVLAQLRLSELSKLSQPVLLERGPIAPLIAATQPTSAPSATSLPSTGVTAKTQATTRSSATTKPTAPAANPK